MTGKASRDKGARAEAAEREVERLREGIEALVLRMVSSEWTALALYDGLRALLAASPEPPL